MNTENLKKMGLISLVVIVIGTITVASWYFKRQVNYTLQYEGLIQEQIDSSLVPIQKSLDKLKLENEQLKLTIQELKKTN